MLGQAVLTPAVIAADDPQWVAPYPTDTLDAWISDGYEIGRLTTAIYEAGSLAAAFTGTACSEQLNVHHAKVVVVTTVAAGLSR